MMCVCLENGWREKTPGKEKDQCMLRLKSLVRLFVAVLLFLPGGVLPASRAVASATDLTPLVNPFVGTDNQGDTYPGAVAPFGMMQLSPNWDNNGYYYPETKMHGFVTRLMSGDGGADEGQVLITATTGPVKVARADTDYTFDHAHESARAGYYQVLMQPWGINAEMTALTRTGMIRFMFPAGVQRNVLVPISYANTPVSRSEVHAVDSRTITGSVTSASFWGGKTITVYFAMVFSAPFSDQGTWTGDTLTPGSRSATQPTGDAPVVGFYGSAPASKTPSAVSVRIGISSVDAQGALANLRAELPDGTTFAACRAQATAAWNSEMGLVDVQGGTLAHRRVFYTALYHALLSPEVSEDADGRYRGYDNAVHTVDPGHTHFYETFSGWDIYRSQIPLLSMIEPTRTQDMAQSVVDMAQQLGFIDRWPEANVATETMTGDPLVICLAHIWNAGLHDFDVQAAYSQMWKQSQAGDPDSHVGTVDEVWDERSGVTLNADVSPSTALEYDESFAALGHLAQSLGKADDANYLFARAQQYRDMYNPATGFLQRRFDDGSWDPSFGGYTEGNQWIYLWFVPEDVQGLASLMGGDAAFERRLDQFFAEKHYDPTNEPDLQAPFLYDYIGKPWKTQRVVAETADRCFTDSPGGLAGGGNDDLGTMSAWYVLSQLGFYCVDPGVPQVELCTPRFPKVILHLASPNGRRHPVFEIDAPAASAADEYIQSATLDGQPLDRAWFPEARILDGGNWTVSTGTVPNEFWASGADAARPFSLSTGSDGRTENAANTIIPTAMLRPALWSYTTRQPPAAWKGLGFDDSAWPTGRGAFGNGYPNVNTPWTDTPGDIWLRKSFVLTSVPQNPVLLYRNDDGMEVYLNGVLATRRDTCTYNYADLPLPVATLKVGTNVIAVHAHQIGGGQIIDVGLFDQTE
jgi:predicted alpha-1,2-mannosidase